MNSIYEKYLAVSDDAQGWLTPTERDGLLAAALTAYVPYAFYIELGAFCGKSTVIIGGVVKESGNGHLYSVDPHMGDLTYPASYINDQLTGPTERSWKPTLPYWKESIAKADLNAYVTCVQSKSTEYYPPFKADFLFIDALHDEFNVRADWNHYKHRIKTNSIVAWHDYGKWYGVTQTVDDLINSGTIDKLYLGDSLMVTQFKGLK